MKRMWNNQDTRVTWTINPSNARDVIRRGLPKAVEAELKNTRDGSLSTYELAEKAGLSNDKRSISRINTALHILESAGLVRKQPWKTDPEISGGTRIFMWSHRAYVNPIPDYENPGINLLRSLYGAGDPSEKPATQIYKENMHLRSRSGSPQGIYTERAISLAAKTLEEKGIISSRKERAGMEEKKFYALTDSGKKLMEQMDLRKMLPESLRKALVE